MSKKVVNKAEQGTSAQSDLAAVLTARRKAIGLRQIDVAKLTGIKRVTIAAYEAGRIVPAPDKIRKLAQALETDVTLLLKSTMTPESFSDIKEKAMLEASLPEEQKLLSDFMDQFKLLDDNYKRMVFNVAKTLYMDN